MSSRALAVFPVLLVAATACGADEVPGITKILVPLVSKIAADPNVGAWTWERNFHGGYLLRMKVDLTGDGKEETFIASSLATVKSRAEWHVFTALPEGEPRPFRDPVKLSWGNLRSPDAPTGPGVLEFSPVGLQGLEKNNERQHRTYRHTFQYPEITSAEIAMTEADEERLLARPPIDLEVVLLEDYLGNPESPPWAKIDEWHFDVDDRFLRPEDRHRATDRVAFTPKVALARLSEIRAELRETSRPGDLPETGRSNHRGTLEAPAGNGPGSGGKGAAPIWSLLAGAVLVLAAAGWMLRMKAAR